MEIERAEADAEGLHRGLANGKASCKYCRSICTSSGKFALAVREDPFDHAWRTSQSSRKTCDVDGVNSHTDHARYPPAGCM
jgi:hypothetical protein